MNKISKQLIIIAETLQKSEQENNVKKFFNKLKNVLNIKTLQKHKLKNKIVEKILQFLDNLQKKGLLTNEQVKLLQAKLNGNNIKTAGKKSFLFMLILGMLSIFSSLFVYCANVSEKEQSDIINLMKSDIYCLTNHIDQKEKAQQAYDEDQKEGTEIVSIFIEYSGDDVSFEHLFQVRVKENSNQIIKPNKMSNKDFEKMKTIIAMFDSKDSFGLKNQVNQSVKKFIEFNDKQLQSLSQFTITRQKDEIGNNTVKVNTQKTLIEKMHN